MKTQLVGVQDIPLLKLENLPEYRVSCIKYIPRENDILLRLDTEEGNKLPGIAVKLSYIGVQPTHPYVITQIQPIEPSATISAILEKAIKNIAKDIGDQLIDIINMEEGVESHEDVSKINSCFFV